MTDILESSTVRQSHLREAAWHIAKAESLMLAAGMDLSDTKWLAATWDLVSYEHSLTLPQNWERQNDKGI